MRIEDYKGRDVCDERQKELSSYDYFLKIIIQNDRDTDSSLTINCRYFKCGDIGFGVNGLGKLSVPAKAKRTVIVNRKDLFGMSGLKCKVFGNDGQLIGRFH
ncbi:MAG: hypothetical protein AAGC95_11470 [Pseudomonadota bacterium]